jgi:hypothetical protein
MRFEFYPLRFQFVARESLYFPPGNAANILRGAFGVILCRIACVPGCQNARACDVRQSCPYARIFEPVGDGGGPSGLEDRPRPFVFRARHLDGKTIQAGQPFHFDLHVFSHDRDAVEYFMMSFGALACEGLGPRRGRAELHCVVPIGACDGTSDGDAAIQLVSLDLTPCAAAAPRKIRVDFLSPTELKHEHRIAQRPEFPILFARIRDRIGALRALYGAGPLDIDFQAVGHRAASVQMTRCEVRRVESTRRSSRTGQTHGLGGFVGTAEYEGDLAEFLPYLEAARWVGVGRHAVWGKGEIALTSL